MGRGLLDRMAGNLTEIFFNLEFLSNNLYLRLVWILDLSKLKIFRLIYFCIARTKLRAPCASDCSFTKLRSLLLLFSFI